MAQVGMCKLFLQDPKYESHNHRLISLDPVVPTWTVMRT